MRPGVAALDSLRLLEHPGILSPVRALDLENELFQRELPETVIRFWRCGRAVVLGRFQTARFEVDTALVARENIPVLWRLTGGGAVFLDPGGALVSLKFPAFAAPTPADSGPLRRVAIEWLQCAVGQLIGPIRVEASGSGLFLNGKKFAGLAAGWNRTGFLLHACFLVESDLDLLFRVLRPDETYPLSGYHGVKSRPSPVLNLGTEVGFKVSDFLEKLKNLLINQLAARSPGALQVMREVKE